MTHDEQEDIIIGIILVESNVMLLWEFFGWPEMFVLWDTSVGYELTKEFDQGSIRDIQSFDCDPPDKLLAFLADYRAH